MSDKVIPANIITGFLGVGKTTTVRHLLATKPEGETWAVLVNEFGDVGIDGAMLADQGALVREVPGGCMCCVNGLPMQIGLNMLLSQKPDRLLIEPSGLGHPDEIISILRGEFYQPLLELRASITLVDPRKLTQSKYLENDIFRKQALISDVLVAAKTDLCTPEDLERFEKWKRQVDASTGREAISAQISQGNLDPSLLNHMAAEQARQEHAPLQHQGVLSVMDLPSASVKEIVRKQRSESGYHACGWIFPDSYQFDPVQVLSLLYGLGAIRAKAVLHTSESWLSINAEDGVITTSSLAEGQTSRLEIIHDTHLDWQAIETQLIAATQSKRSSNEDL
ncbi:CobW family GTP-binding protein [Hahella ganghwensis]|uniref:CobW family GTP-binding protein n=1 Tax=Hahella ganghwensis TaxID=286420 RepID=UPI00037BF8DB|nr:GTP-binding protein [Hahella ganghwensis]